MIVTSAKRNIALTTLILILILAPNYLSAQCNGDPNVCNRRYNEVCYVTTHNAYNYSGPFQGPNQTFPVSQQMTDGVRAFMLDVYMLFGKPTMYHGALTVGTLGNEPLEDVLVDIRSFIEQNPNEVITLIFECYITADEMDTVFTSAGLKPYLHEQDSMQPWPTLQDMINSGKTLVVFSDVDDAGTGQGWYHYMWDYQVETDYSAKSRADFSCDFNRGDSINELFIFNHFITDAITGTGEYDSAVAINANPYLIDRANQCITEKAKFINYLTVDFYETGDVFATKNSLNDAFVVSNDEIEINQIDFNIHPNPFHNTTTISFSSELFALNTELNIIDVTGRLINSYKIPKGKTEFTVHGDDIGMGIFFVQLISDGQILANQKVVIISGQ